MNDQPDNSFLSTKSQAASAAGHVTQSTAIEQSRAVAEVQSAIVVAQQNPRSTNRALETMRESCGMMFLAEKAFFSMPRAGSTVSGPSVHLARELARIWGNINYGVKELSRDDERGQSEMMAVAWDLETNARNEAVFIVEHKRDNKKGVAPTVLTSMNDIYENNANMGARRVRECIFAILPPWVVSEAKQTCMTTLEKGDGIPLAKRVEDCIAAFGNLGINKEQLEKKIRRVVDKWDIHDMARMSVLFQSIRNGEINKEDEFGLDGNALTSEDVAKNKPTSKKAKPEQDTQQPDDDGDGPDDDNPPMDDTFPGDR